MSEVVVFPVEDEGHLAIARELIGEYASLPHVVGRWPGREAELEGLPAPYTPPSGVILLATLAGAPVGCVALACLEEPHVCEMKRLYVRDRARGHGVGRALVLAVVDHARGLDYATMRLDTAPELAAARGLYAALGFREIAPYHDRYPGAVYFELELR